jgi:hypothetical protein
MKLTDDEIEVWIDAYIRHYDNIALRNGNDENFWAVERFTALGHTEPEACWKAIVNILDKSPSNTVLANLAAGPLEDLIESHGSEYIDVIETSARKNPRFSNLLGGVWKCSSPDIWERVKKLGTTTRGESLLRQLRVDKSRI